jgi:hypothetical protein
MRTRLGPHCTGGSERKTVPALPFPPNAKGEGTDGEGGVAARREGESEASAWRMARRSEFILARQRQR